MRRAGIRPGFSGGYKCDRGNGHVDRHRYVGGRCHVVHAQQIKTRQQASEHRSGDVRGVEKSEPGNFVRPASQSGQRRAHQHSGGQETDGRDDSAKRDAGHERHQQQHQDSENADAELDCGVHAQRMAAGGDQARKDQAAETHSSHEGGEEDAERNGSGADDQFQ